VNNTVYIGSHDKKIYALDIKEGLLKWAFCTNGKINYSSPTVVRDVVYIGSQDNYLYALDAKNGELKWKFKSLGWIESSPAVFEDTVFFG